MGAMEQLQWRGQQREREQRESYSLIILERRDTGLVGSQQNSTATK
jgi:hypothetical protein